MHTGSFAIIKLSIIFIVFGFSGCTNYYIPGCGSASTACLAAAVTTNIVTNDRSSSQKCSDMTGEKKVQCDAQVKAVNKHIEEASNK